MQAGNSAKSNIYTVIIILIQIPLSSIIYWVTNFTFLCKDFVVDLYCGSAGVKGGGGEGEAVLAFQQTGLEPEGLLAMLRCPK